MTHLTVDRARGVKPEHVKDYGNQCTPAGQGVNLLKVIVNKGPGPLRNSNATKKGGTDPYCPPARAMPSDDAPFIMESDKELPAGTENPVRMRLGARVTQR